MAYLSFTKKYNFNSYIFVVIVSSILIIYTPKIKSQTIIKDTVSGVWTKENSPYIITSNIIIPKDSSLIIQKGVEVKFDGYYSFTISGLLFAEGTKDDSIKFFPSSPEIMWNGLKFKYADSSSLKYCLIEKSRAQGDSLKGAGGGIKCIGSNLNINNCTIRNNTSETNLMMLNGAAICALTSKLVMHNNTISYNSGSGGAGGGIFSDSSTLNISSSTITNNSSFNLSGMEFSPGGAVFIKGTPPDAMYNAYLITNNLICRNTGTSAAAIYAPDDYTFINNNTIVFNETYLSPSAAKIQGLLVNNIIYFNEWSGDKTQIISTGFVRYNDIDGLDIGYLGNGNFNLAPLFLDSENNNFHLSANSPCIDAGDPASEYNNEPDYNGMRINLGHFGNTSEATTSNPDVLISSANILFDTLYLGDSTYKNLTVKNVGTSRLNLKIRSNNEFFIADTGKEYSILGGDSISLQIIFSPLKTSEQFSDIEMVSNDKNNPVIDNRLTGYGKLGKEFFGRLHKKYSPYTVSEDLIIPDSENLLIEPGVVLKFDTLTGIKSYGNLTAIGTEGDSIIFTSSSNPVAGSWRGISIEGSDSSDFQFCKYQYALRALSFSASFADISNSYFENQGINCHLFEGKILKNEFHNTGTGILVSDADCLIDENIFEKVDLGISILMGQASINKNTFANVTNGIYSFYSRVDLSQNNITGNNISNNFRADFALLNYKKDSEIQGLNGKWGIVSNENILSDVLLLNETTIGSRFRNCIQVVNGTFDQVQDIPQSYQPFITVPDYNKTIVIKTLDGGHIKMRVIYTIFGGDYKGLLFSYIYLPPGNDKFPSSNSFSQGFGNQFNIGFYDISGRIKMVDNEISSFNSGISFNGSIVDTFINNTISNNSRSGIFFKSHSTFIAGSNEEAYNEVYNNNGLNFIYSSENDITLPYFYWGFDSSYAIANSIADNKVISTVGKVNFRPYLTESHEVITSTPEVNPGTITEYSLSQNYPNPFNPTTKISYQIKERGFTRLTLYDAIGNQVAVLVNEEKPQGRYSIEVDGSNLASGIYFYQLKSNGFTSTKKMIMLK